MFTKLSWFAPKFMESKKMKMRRFEEGLASYIRQQLGSQPNLSWRIWGSSWRGASQVRVKGLEPKAKNQKREWVK